jgi:membrane protein implicated in regulation of membrane protease activity
VRKLLWVIIFVVCSLAIFATGIFSFPSIQRAINKNGSIWAYVFFSINIGIYLSIIISVIVTVIVRITKYVKKNQIC